MLTVMVLGVSHLLKGLQGSRGSYVKVYLLPRLLVSWQMVLQCSSLHPVRQEPCRLGRYSLEELRSFTLRFAIYARFRSLKGSFVGEVLFRCAQAIWDPQPSSSYSWELLSTKTQLRKANTSSSTFTTTAVSSAPRRPIPPPATTPSGTCHSSSTSRLGTSSSRTSPWSSPSCRLTSTPTAPRWAA
ncbi:uncharacterized protein LOC113483861 isoform X2 [Athene cunicularia]|uniref:uncharacterized protein LOC113483861 isoform X2 n=1 Tax=Athene cunicularia TaxID=194338 RepID=UPI000EF6F458|nr:uncharacterized protein LOC113483861 isoform X2 [Athene cunicularia]